MECCVRARIQTVTGERWSDRYLKHPSEDDWMKLKGPKGEKNKKWGEG